MNKIYYSVTIFILSVLLFASNDAMAKPNKEWCVKNSKHYIVHWITGNTKAENKEVKLKLKPFLSNVYSKIGAKLTIVEQRPNSIIVSKSWCIPGCKSTNWIKEMAGYACQTVVANKDKKEASNRIKFYLQKMFNRPPNRKIDLFHELTKAANYYQNKKTLQTSDKVMLITSLEPLVGIEKERKNYDAHFVKVIQEKKTLPRYLNLLAINCVGGTTEIVDFWRDIFEALSIKDIDLTCS